MRRNAKKKDSVKLINTIKNDLKGFQEGKMNLNVLSKNLYLNIRELQTNTINEKTKKKIGNLFGNWGLIEELTAKLSFKNSSEITNKNDILKDNKFLNSLIKESLIFVKQIEKLIQLDLF